MAKKVKTVKKTGSGSRSGARRSTASSKSKKSGSAPKTTGKAKSSGSGSKGASKKPWLTVSGAVDKRKSISKYLRSDGTLDRRYGATKGLKSASQLYKRLQAEAQPKPREVKVKELPPWFNKEGKVKAEMLKYLTKKGHRRKGVSFPVGIRSFEKLYEYVQAGKITAKDITEKEDKRLSSQNVTMAFWEAQSFIDTNFDLFRKVYMGGQLISRNKWDTEGDDHINEVKNENDSPPSVTMTIARYKRFRFLYF